MGTSTLQDGARYVGTVIEGSRLFQSNAKKTPGFQVRLELDTGGAFKEPIDYTIWLTPKNKERAAGDFKTLGVEESRLSSRSFVQYELAQVIVGTQVEVEIRAETYRDETRLKAAAISPVGAADEGELVGAFVGIFGSKEMPPPLEDDDIPF